MPCHHWELIGCPSLYELSKVAHTALDLDTPKWINMGLRCYVLTCCWTHTHTHTHILYIGMIDATSTARANKLVFEWQWMHSDSWLACWMWRQWCHVAWGAIYIKTLSNIFLVSKMDSFLHPTGWSHYKHACGRLLFDATGPDQHKFLAWENLYLWRVDR